MSLETAEQFKQLADGTPLKDMSVDELRGIDMKAISSTSLPDFSTVTLFEQKIADFFGAPYAVAVDSCTHGLELCLRYMKANQMCCPVNTYVSVPMLADKLNIKLDWVKIIDETEIYKWSHWYGIGSGIIDAATFWQKNGYREESFMCLSFQYQKHLSLGRGGMILCDNKEAAETLKRMSYDGRLPGIPWREQDIDVMGYHYYMTPETAQKGLDKLQAAIDTPPRIWSSEDYPDITTMQIFRK